MPPFNTQGVALGWWVAPLRGARPPVPRHVVVAVPRSETFTRQVASGVRFVDGEPHPLIRGDRY
jgi:hypothetical protein